MYKKNLTKHINLRLTSSQLSFLACLAEARKCSTSDVIRDILDYYILEWEDLAYGNKQANINRNI